MADIQYDEDPQFEPEYQKVKQKSLFVRLVINTGIVSTNQRAEHVLVGIAALATVLAFAIPVIVGSNVGNSSPRVSPEQLQQIMKGTPQHIP